MSIWRISLKIILSTGSVFDLIPDKDKEKMEAVKKIPGVKPSGSSAYVPADFSHSYPVPVPSQPASSQKSVPEQNNVQQQQEQEQRSSGVPLFRGGTSGFKPFVNNPEKQKRYERYLEIRKQGKKCKLCCRLPCTDKIKYPQYAEAIWT